MRYLLFLPLLTIIGCHNTTNTSSNNEVAQSENFQPLEKTPKPDKSDHQLGLLGYAKVFCSAIFVSGREPAEAFQNSGYFFMPDEDNAGVKWDIDYGQKMVSLTLGDSLEASARYYGDQGCIIQTEGGIKFKPVEVSSQLPAAASQPWPMGDDQSVNPESGIHPDSLEKALDLAFDEKALTAAYLVVYQGKIIGERYRDGINQDTQLESWSMGKSLTATLIGRMIHLGYFQLDDKAPVAEWSRKGDPRENIHIRDLLQMSSGLRFTSHRDPDVATHTRYLDHMFIYSGAVNAFRYSVNRPLQFPVGTEGRYRNCDPLTLGYIMRKQLESKNIDYHTFPQQELFDKIGIRKQVMETDPHGNFLLTGYDYGTARNWARLGLLYLNDGLANGERILPEGWSSFVSTPAPAWKDPIYGGQFWLNRLGNYPIPTDAYYMAGGGGQRTIIVPSKDLVVVRLGHFRGGRHSDQALSRSLATLMNSLPQH